MRKAQHLTLSLVFAALISSTATAQENFQEVPSNHWAYQALQGLRNKVVFGFPDGLYRGRQPMTRYEFAVAVNQLSQLLTNRTLTLQDQIKALEAQIKNGTNKSVLESIQSEINSSEERVKRLEDGREELKKLVQEFERELASLGVDVDTLKKATADLGSRISKLESARPKVSISGDATLLVLGGYSVDGNFGLSQGRESLGIGRGSYAGAPVGATRDLTVAHEMGLTLDAKIASGIKFKSVTVLGNLLNTIGSKTGGFSGSLAEGPGDLFIDELSVQFDRSLLGESTLTLGRFGHRSLDFVMRRSDRTPYLEQERYDNGKMLIDGGLLNWTRGKSRVNLFGGRTQAETSSSKTRLTPNQVRLQGVNPTASSSRVFGADSRLNLGPVNLDLAYVVLDSDTLVLSSFNQLHSMGAEATYVKDKLSLKAAAAKSVIKENNEVRKSAGANAYLGEAAFNEKRWGVSGGWREVEAYFSNPGSWGRIGTQRSPSGFRGFQGRVWVKPMEDLTLSVRGDYLKGAPYKGVAGNLGLTSGDAVQTYALGAEYQASNQVSLEATYENVLWNFAGPANAYQRWLTVGMTWEPSEGTSVKLFWQHSDADDKGTGAFAFFGLGPSSRYKGGMIGSQVSLKF